MVNKRNTFIFQLSPEELEKFRAIQKELGITSNVDTFRYLITKYLKDK